MIKITELVVGTAVQIYEDPIEETTPEGMAVLVEDLTIMMPGYPGTELHHWRVKFEEEGLETDRWIKVKVRK